MAIAGSNLIVDGNMTPAASFATGSIAPGANRLLLASVFAVDNAVTLAPTVNLSGNGLTWVQVGRLVTGVASLAVFRALGASPSAGAVTISSDVATMLFAQWSISEFTGVNTTGSNGSGAVGNVATNYAGSASSLTVTLPAFGSASNGTYGAFSANDFGSAAAFTFTEGTGFTPLGSDIDAAAGATVAVGMFAQWKAANDTSVDVSASRPMTDFNGIAVEIVASAVGPAASHYYRQAA